MHNLKQHSGAAAARSCAVEALGRIGTTSGSMSNYGAPNQAESSVIGPWSQV